MYISTLLTNKLFFDLKEIFSHLMFNRWLVSYIALHEFVTAFCVLYFSVFLLCRCMQ